MFDWKFRAALAAAGFVVAAAVAAPDAGAEWSGTQEQREGVLHILNSDTPQLPPLKITLDEQWRIGTDDDDEFFGVISRVTTDSDGNVYALDSQLTEVRVYDADGNYLRTVGREGEGPGEFRNPNDMYLGLGDKIGVLQVFPGKVVQLSKDGDPLDNFRLPEVEGGGFQLVFNAMATRDRLVMAGAQMAREGQEQMQVTYLKAFADDGTELVHFYDEARENRFGNMKYEESTFSNFQRRWTLGGDGRVYAALTFGEYVIHVWNADGTPDRVIRRDSYVPASRNRETKKRFQRLYDGVTSWNPNSEFSVSDHHVAVGSLSVRGDGTLWVLSGHGTYETPEGVAAAFDIYDSEGRFVRQAHLIGDFDPTEDATFFRDGRLYVVTSSFSSVLSSMGGGDDDEAMEEPEPVTLVCYKLVSEL